MPQIQEYNAPVRGLQPDEIGVTAVQRDARIVQQYGNQRAAVTRQGFEDVSGGLKSFGEQIDAHQALQEETAGASAISQAYLDLDKKLKDYLSNPTNARDPNAAANFMKSTAADLQPLLDAPQTPAGKRYMAERVAQLQQHFADRAVTDAGTVSFQYKLGDSQTAITNASSLAYRDPTSVDAGLGLIDGLVKSWTSDPSLPADRKAEIARLSDGWRREIVQSGASALAQNNPGALPAFEAKYGSMIDGKQLDQIKQEGLRIRIMLQDNAMRTQEFREREIDRQGAQAIMQNVTTDPSTGRVMFDPKYLQALNNPNSGISATVKENALRFYETMNNAPAIAPNHADTMNELLHLPAMFSQNSDMPTRILQEIAAGHLSPYEGKLALAIHNSIGEGLDKLVNSPQAKQEEQLAKAKLGLTDFLGPKDPAAQEKFNEWYMNKFIPALKQARDMNTDLTDLFNPTSNNYYMKGGWAAYMGISDETGTSRLPNPLGPVLSPTDAHSVAKAKAALDQLRNK